MVAFGWIVVFGACALFLFKLFVAYDSRGGDGGVPLMDGVIFPPVFVVAGLYFAGIHWPWWCWAGVWVGGTAFAFAAVEGVSRIAGRRW